MTSFTDANGNVTRYTYDSKGNLLSTIYPNQSVERIGSYDPMGDALSFINRRGQTLGYTYNGAGQVTKSCNQVVQVVCLQGVAEALMLARANGVDPARVVDALMPGIAGSKVLDVYGRNMAARNFSTDIEARLHHKDFGLVVEIAEHQGVPMPATALVLAQLEKLMEQGWGRNDTSILLRVLEEERKAHVQ
jgi:YD repeat-containing protein